ncbi:hypothetical protein DI273_10410 [Streptomyces violascens]|uniref:hypothetical protein n=1 Tax=Streptomyces albidoflavus TaxID=1886 RepID=UPI0018C1B02C|nr:hypothetical protein DI273_10410 [Streptomyces violascens]
MTYDRLVCAHCASPVSEGRCRMCLAHRERMRQEGPFGGLSPAVLAVLAAVLLLALALLVAQAV